MDDFEKQLKRKISIRKTAMENLGIQEEFDQQFSSMKGVRNERDNVNEKLYFLLNENIKEADENSFQNGYWLLTGKKVSVLIKKVLRKMVRIFYGWYVFPMMARQSHFNGKTVNSLNILKDIVTTQNQMIDDLIQHCNDIQLQLKETKQMQQLQFDEMDHSLQDKIDEQIQIFDEQIQIEAKEIEMKISDIKKSVNYFERQIAPGFRLEVQEKRSAIINGIDDFDLIEKVQQIEHAIREEVDEKLRDATVYFINNAQRKIDIQNNKKKKLIVVLCLRFRKEHGMEAIKNEAYDLFQLLLNESIYNTKLVSIEDLAEKPKLSDSIIYVDNNSIEECINKLSPSLIVLFESTPYYVFESKGLLIKNHTLIKLTGQNPLQGLDEKTLDELRHCNDYGVHRFLVESDNAFNIMVENGFRNVSLSHPIVNTERIRVKRLNKKSNSPFVVGFASAPMVEEQFNDRGMDILLETVEQMPDVVFKILWRNELLNVPMALKEAKNCQLITGKYDMKLFYQEIDCVIIPYKTEDNNHACSLSGIEAMLNNIPVISTNVAGISDIVRKYELGIVCNPTAEDLIAAIDNLRHDYEQYIDQQKSNQLREFFESKQIVSIIEETLEDYFPTNFVTLEEWDYHLKKNDKYLVKGHKIIKNYYQNEVIANSYNEVRFIKYPGNYFDAFERASIGIVIKNHFNSNDIEILDIASGDGRIVQENINYGFCTSIDSSIAMLNIVEKRFGSSQKLKTILGDYFIDNLEDKYDVITTFRYIRHYDYKQRKLLYKRIYNNLKSGGMLIFDAPNIKYAMNTRGIGNWGEFNIYDVFWDEKSIIQELEENNFNVKYLIPIGIKTIDEEPVSWTVAAVKG